VNFGLMGTGVPFIRFVPAVEIDTPTNGAVYSPGQVVDAAWSCLAVDPLEGSLAQNCTASAASGSPIDTSPGTHTFTVQGIAASNAEPVSATVTYTVAPTGGGSGGGTAGGGASGGSGGGGGPGRSGRTTTAHGAAAGLTFALSAPAMCLAPGANLRAVLVKGGSSKTYRAVSYSYYVDRGTANRKRVTVNGKRKTITVYAPTLATTRGGAVTLALKHVSAGTHKLRLVVLLRAVSAHRKPKTQTVTVSLMFTVCREQPHRGGSR
jgi:hypothetical protein